MTKVVRTCGNWTYTLYYMSALFTLWFALSLTGHM